MKRNPAETNSRGAGVSPARAAHVHGREAHATGKALLRLLPALLFLIAAGCQEPNYRTEVTGNGEGGVEIHRVPKDPSETAVQPAPEMGKSPLEQRVEVLEATVLRQQEEIVTLRRELNAKNTTATAP
jgi:hypothetical protein